MRAAKTLAQMLAAFAIYGVTTSSGVDGKGREIVMEPKVCYRTVKVDGLSIFYREAGPIDAPAILLLHGLPSSSRMFQPLLTRLSDRFHLAAPDYPGFGHSEWPDPEKFDYTYDRIALVMEHFTRLLGLRRYREQNSRKVPLAQRSLCR